MKVPTLGFIGLGAMGSRMARRLLDAGHAVVGYNRTAAKAAPLVAAGMTLASSPRRVAEAADVVFSMVSHTQALDAIATGPDGVLAGLRARRGWK
jgi:3-hydroxyisobutyrate dehydrogenase-like beta-hydroxyacid dehydrogenase